jgi:uncharacterized delta-60 repeat protein
MTFVADENGTDDTVIFQLQKDLTLNPSFGSTPGYVNLPTNYGGTTGMYVDSLGDIFVVGNTGGSGTPWAQGFSSAGGSIGFTTNTFLASVQAVAQQSNGRIIVAGLGSAGINGTTNGCVVGFNTTGTFDSSFASTGTNSSVNMGAAIAITDIAIDSTVYYDNIIAVSNNSGSVVLQRVSASGLSLATLSGGTAVTGAVGNVKVVYDSNGYIIVAAATSTGFIVRSYNNNGTATNNASAAVTFTAGTTPVLSNIYATSDGKITLVGYDSATTGSTPGYAIVARLVSSAASLTLDTTAFNAAGTSPSGPGFLVASIGSMDQVFDGIIHADDRIMLVGSNHTAANPYMGRVFGDTYVSYRTQGPTEAIAGTLNTAFGSATPTTGLYTISGLNAVLTGAQGKAIFPLSDGGYYMAFDNANTAANSVLIKTLADGTLDTTYNTSGTGHIAGIAGSLTSPNYAPLGVNSILQDGSNRLLLVGTDASNHGWVQRYTAAGALDTSFAASGTGKIDLSALTVPGTKATVAVEQTLGRLVVAGQYSGGAILYAFTSLAPQATYTGLPDTTFNAGAGGTPGYVEIASTNGIYNLVADSYDRLIFAVLNTAGNAVDLYRLTPTGELDATFGTAGKVAAVIATAANAPSSVRVALDAAGHIIVAANSSTANTVSVRAFDNLSAASGNGAPIYAQLNISSGFTSPSVTGLVTSADGYALILGTQSTTGAAWIARITAIGALDSGAFNPSAIGGTAGIFKYSAGGGTTDPAHVYNGLAVNKNGTLGMIGYETTAGPVYTPTLVAVYDDPYTSQQSQSPDSKAVGSVDLTLGLTGTNGITYYGSGTLASYGQVARALALYDDNNIVVAIDGANATNTSKSSIFINMFDNDGLLNTSFNSGGATPGTAIVLQGAVSPVSPNFENQYVNDMITFTTASNVRKAIVAGYTYNSTLATANQYSSLLLQYVLTPSGPGLDTANFGGFNGSPAGIAFGDGKKLNVVGQQSTGRIIAGGLSQDNLGLLLGYTAAGKLDTSFGNGGYQSTGTGSTGIYSHAIDTQNRVVIAYNSGTGAGTGTVNVARMLADGSGLDSSFATPTPLISTVTSSDNMKVAVDSSNNVIVAAVTASGNTIAVKQYPAAGGTATETAAITGTNLGNASAVYTIARLLVDAQNNVIVVAYDTNATQVVVMRLVISGGSYILDSTFNNTTGYVLYTVPTGTASQVAKDAMIHPDGRIIIVGSEA